MDTAHVVIAARIAIVEDDADLRRVLVEGLREEDFEVRAYTTGTELLAGVDSRPADALVVDIGLPDADGRDLCQALRARGVQTPVLFLTARDALPDRLSGFSAGGDDYMTKPFSLDELIARLHALLRRASPDLAPEVGGMRLDPAAHAISCGDKTTRVTPTEFRLLAALASRPGDVVRRRELIQAAWPHGAIVHDNTLDAYVARLRRKLRELDGAPEISTAHSVGYSLG
jgi:two-component system OmpR family response regulator